ncbi:alpha/beta-hydrolase [Amniculicola lignicola CBS 123094]|uniref:Alpha/beta-hydrolase n=1 Tax=Amniculicola lignicola CBS 123094 TaxID=1392246 RepID=A0A6A5WQS1_9PLEO|nr:alpha/beta-hydrolase [Amniculicola lignicola CBS 123094]
MAPNDIPGSVGSSTSFAGDYLCIERDAEWVKREPYAPLTENKVTRELWSQFHVKEYKFQSEIEIPVLFLWPKRPTDEEVKEDKEGRPIHVRFFGGGFCTGSADNVDWYPPWKLRMMKDTNSITIAPNHRLLPEANGQQILADIDAFWANYDGLLNEFLKDHDKIRANKNKLLITGTSSGGFAAMHSWLGSAPQTLKAVFLAYPMLASYAKEPGDYRGVQMSSDVARKSWKRSIERIQELRERGELQYRVGSIPPEGMDMSCLLPMVREDNGITAWQNCFGEDDILQRVQAMSLRDMPEHHAPIFIAHGRRDNPVPAAHSTNLKKWLQEACSPGSLLIDIWFKDTEPNDHGFDTLENELGEQPLEDRPNNTGLQTMIKNCKMWWLTEEWNQKRNRDPVPPPKKSTQQTVQPPS